MEPLKGWGGMLNEHHAVQFVCLLFFFVVVVVVVVVVGLIVQ